VFPQDPGNLRETPGCEGCHSTLDPLADFFKVWGEGGSLYSGKGSTSKTHFAGKDGSSMEDLADIIRGDNAFATCTVQNAWTWLMGRPFYHDEADLRAVLTKYFVATQYNFKELLYALATHSAFTDGSRSDATVGDPLSDPPLGEPPGGVSDRPCDTSVSWAADVQPNIGRCTTCHNGTGGRQDLQTFSSWTTWGSQALNMIASGNMPPGQAGPPVIGAIYDLKEAVRCWIEQGKAP
jgi:hypothetical protein